MSTAHSTALIDARDVSVTLGGREVLKHQHLSVGRGEIVAVLGPSGCGKTTLLRTIARLQRAHGGVLCFEQRSYSITGIDASAEEDATFYPAVTYVPQTLALWPHFSNYQNAALATRGDPDAAAMIQMLARRLNVESVLAVNPAGCSHGQRQRIALIRGLVLKPRLLLLDEITSALDRENTQRVASLLTEFAAGGGAVIVITHDLRFAKDCAGRILEMDAHGTLTQLCAEIHDELEARWSG